MHLSEIRLSKAFQPETPPEAGTYWMKIYRRGARLRKGFRPEAIVRPRVGKGRKVAVRVWYGPPIDPLTGEEMDRSYRWMATINGFVVPMRFVWPWCANHRISEIEYHDLLMGVGNGNGNSK